MTIKQIGIYFSFLIFLVLFINCNESMKIKNVRQKQSSEKKQIIFYEGPSDLNEEKLEANDPEEESTPEGDQIEEKEEPEAPGNDFLAYQLALVEENNHVFYKASEEINSNNENIIISFIYLNKKEMDFDLYIEEYESNSLIYDANIYGIYKVTENEVLFDLEYFEENLYGLSEFSNSEFVVDLKDQDEFTLESLLRNSSEALKDLISYDLAKIISTHIEVQKQNIIRNIFAIEGFNDRYYVFYPSNSKEFEISKIDYTIQDHNLFKTYLKEDTLFSENINLYQSGTNDLNINTTDDVYFYEPSIIYEYNEQTLNVILSNEEAEKLIISKFQEANITNYGSIQPLPNIKKIEFILNSCVSDEVKLEKDIDLSKKIIFSLNAEEEKNICKPYIVFLDNSNNQIHKITLSYN
ncbi:MAG: hypothetical protein ABIA04_05890 [Pseudomonadota bacterium]